MWGRFCIYFGVASSLLATVGLYSDALLITYISFILQSSKTNGEPYKYSSINVYLCAVRDWHIKNGLPVPTARPLVRRALLAAKKFCRRQGRVERKWPISAAAMTHPSVALVFDPQRDAGLDTAYGADARAQPGSGQSPRPQDRT